MSAARVVALAAAALAAASGAHAQSWPAKPLRMISPYPPGGGIDGSARIISQALSEQLGQQVVIENRPGASGRIGTEVAAKAPPDGYTFVLGSVAPNAIIPSAAPKLPYNALKDFAPISLVAATEYVLVVHPSLPVRSVKELIALARAKPRQLTYASSGNLGAPHLAGELLDYLAKVSTVHVPYKGTGPAALAVLTGETVMAFGSGPAVMGHIQTGRLRALATTGAKRTISGLPTMGETLPGYVVTQWYGVLAPAGTPAPIVERVNKEIARAIHNPKVAQQFSSLGAEAVSTTPAEFAALIRSDMEKWGRVIRAAGIPVE
jgi:tripartite-type tricarboxylate transporter receptor subunit TctC